MSGRHVASMALLVLFAVACRVGGGSAAPASPAGEDAPAPAATAPAPAEGEAPAAKAAVAVGDPAPTAAKAEGAVAVEVVPQYGALYAPGDATLNVLVRLRGAGEATGDRPPLDLAVVIDRSGSMSGDKILAVKQAALELVNRLGPRDRVTLISYSTDVRVHQTRRSVDEAGRADLRRAILGLAATGSTALGPALMQGLEILEGASRRDTELAHLLLLSDGLANHGESRPAVLAARTAAAFRRGVSVSTLGVGLDYNEDLMTKLADQGGGRYHFIREPSAIAGVLTDEMSGLAQTVARGVELALRPGAGVRVEKVYGYPVTTDDGAAAVRVGALAAGQTREIVMRLRVAGPAAAGVALGRFDVRFRDVAADGAARTVGLEASVARAADEAAMRASERAEVTVRVAEVESAEQLEMAARAAQEGRFDDARQVLQVAIGQLEKQHAARPSPKLRKQIESMEEAAREVDQARTSVQHQKTFTKKYKARSYDLKK